MIVAAQRTNYSGTFVYKYDNQIETTRITHVWDHDGEHGRLEGMDAIRQKIIQHSHQRLNLPGTGQTSMHTRASHQSFPSFLPDQLSLLSKNYRLVSAEEARVAGITAQAFILRPRDNLRYTQKIWAHTDSGLPVKAAVLDDRSQVVEQYYFTHLEIGGQIDRKWISRNKSSSGYHSYHPVPGSVPENSGSVHGASGWHAGYLPPGFEKTVEIQRKMREEQASATQLVYSEGLAGISIFIEDTSGGKVQQEGLTSRGAINIYRKKNGNNWITVVGEAPPRTVMQIAGAVRYQAQ